VEVGPGILLKLEGNSRDSGREKKEGKRKGRK
jgi:hypothetical protein